MCYMEARQVGVRELRQNLSKYLRRVERGERLEVTDHGRPVAVLAPLPAADRPLTRLVASGRLSPPEADLLALLPPKGRPTSRVSRALEEGREDRV
jgi:prevent-host-death family protein